MRKIKSEKNQVPVSSPFSCMHWVLLTCTKTEQLRIIEKWPVLVSLLYMKWIDGSSQPLTHWRWLVTASGALERKSLDAIGWMRVVLRGSCGGPDVTCHSSSLSGCSGSIIKSLWIEVRAHGRRHNMAFMARFVNWTGVGATRIWTRKGQGFWIFYFILYL